MITENDLKDGDLILVSNYPDNPETIALPWGIRQATRCYYHHCAIYFAGHVYQSVKQGVCQTHTIDVYLQEVGQIREVAICRFPNFNLRVLQNTLWLPYNFGSLIWQLIAQMTGTYLGSKNPNSRNCSQFAAECLGYENWYEIDPQDLWRDACKNGLVVKESHPKRREYVNKRLND